MATGILSIGEAGFGQEALSMALLAVAGLGYAVLCLLFVLRGWRFPRELWADTARPERAFSFYTFVAASNVLAVRLDSAGLAGPGRGLAVAGAVAWLLLAYAILARVMLAPRKPAPEAAVNGSWLIWVVGTQSVSVAISVLGAGLGLQPSVAALAAVVLWGFGMVLYLLLMGIILARLVLAPLDPVQATPPYWITMGATAITVVAGADLLGLPRDLPALLAARSTIEGFTLFLWSFGTWWFPFLVLLTVWRYRTLSAPAFEGTLWSMVFPLGMYAVATDAYGHAAGLPLLPEIAQAEIWLALAAWVGVAGWMAISWFSPDWPSAVRPGSDPRPVGAAGGTRTSSRR
jgi:tellurite resistance protein TehA-like permease